MTKQYVGSQQHLEDNINDYYDKKEQIERDQYILYNKPIVLTLKEYNESRYPISDLFK